jgi:hypothetical protein
MRTLAIRPGAIGDLILSLPALEFLKSGYLEVWTSGATVPLVRFADRVRSIASTGIDLLGVAEPPSTLLPELRSFDRILSWYGANRTDFRELIGSLGLVVEFHRALPPEGRAGHATDFYLGQLRGDSSVLGQPQEELAAAQIPRYGARGRPDHAGGVVRRAGRSAARRRRPDRRPLRFGLLAGPRPSVRGQRFRHHASGGGGGCSGIGPVRSHRSGGVGATRAERAGGAMAIAEFGYLRVQAGPVDRSLLQCSFRTTLILTDQTEMLAEKVEGILESWQIALEDDLSALMFVESRRQDNLASRRN